MCAAWRIETYEPYTPWEAGQVVMQAPILTPVPMPTFLETANTTANTVTPTAEPGKLSELALKKKLGTSVWNLIKQQPELDALRVFILNKTNKYVPEDIKESDLIIDWLRTALYVPPPPPPPPPPPKPKSEKFTVLIEGEVMVEGTAKYSQRITRSGEIYINKETLLKFRNESTNRTDFQRKVTKYLEDQAREQNLDNIPLYNRGNTTITEILTKDKHEISYCSIPYANRLISNFLGENDYNFETKTEITDEMKKKIEEDLAEELLVENEELEEEDNEDEDENGAEEPEDEEEED